MINSVFFLQRDCKCVVYSPMMHLGVWTVIVTMLTWTKVTDQTTGGSINTLRILLIAPFPDKLFKPPYNGGHNLIPSALVAVDEINNSSSVLAGYTLEPIIADGGCDNNGKAVSAMLRNVVHRSPGDHIVGIVGPVCSEATQVLSDLLNGNRVRLPLVTIANSPELGNNTRYPFTYGIVSTSVEFARTAVALYTVLNADGKWKNISMFYDSNRLYHVAIYRAVMEELRLENVSMDSVYGSPISPTYLPLEDVMRSGIRIVFVFSSKEPACMLMCRALHLGMTYPNYQFIFTDRTLEQFQSCVNESKGTSLVFKYNLKEYKCTNDQIVEALNRAIMFHFKLEALSLEPNTTQTVSGNTFQEYRNKYEQRLSNYSDEVEEDLSPSAWAAPLYDAVWAVALAANRTLPNLNLDSTIGIWAEDQITDAFENLSFRGVSTAVKFDPVTGFSDSIISISRLERASGSNEMTTVLKGYYNSGRLYDADDRNSNDVVLFLYIESAFEKSIEKLPFSLSITGYILAMLVLAATICYHVLHFIYRDRPSIKAVSPQLNHFIFLGCYMTLTSVILDTTDVGFSPENTSRHLGLCYAVVWFESIGVTLVFSTLFVKYYRLYLVFLRTYDHRSNLSNGKLSLIVAGLVSVEVLILALWIPFEPLKIETTVDFDHSSAHPVNREKKICMPTESGRWFVITASLYLALLILAVVTLSFLNRRIKQRDFNTTLTTNLLVYLYILLLTILLPSVYIDSNYSNINLKYGLINAVYLTFTILCLALLFTPPLMQRNKKDNAYSLTQQLHKISALVTLSTRLNHNGVEKS